MKFRSSLIYGVLSSATIRIGLISSLLSLQAVITPSVAQSAISKVKKTYSPDISTTETYKLLILYGNVLELVRSNYVDPVSTKELITNALDGMLSGLDPHSSYMTEKQYADMNIQTKGEFGGLGIEIQGEDGHVKIVSPIDGTPAARAGIKPGDYIIAINGKNVDGLPLNDVVEKIRGKPNTLITLTLVREKSPKPIIVNLLREIIHIQVIKSALYDQNIGYIRISQFNEDTNNELIKALNILKKQAGDKLRGLILDLRNDPGGLLNQAIDVSSNFIKQGEIVSIRSRHASDNRRWNAKGVDLTNGLPLVVLINSGSASASEIVAGALQDHHRAVLLGEKSFGKGSVQTIIPIPNNGAVRLTTARYYTPSGHSIQGLGITPDIIVKDTAGKPAFSLRESDLEHIIKNEGGNPSKPPLRPDLPAIIKSIPRQPPANWPEFDFAKPNTDFQLQQALRVVRSMAGLPDKTLQIAASNAPASPVGSKEKMIP